MLEIVSLAQRCKKGFRYWLNVNLCPKDSRQAPAESVQHQVAYKVSVLSVTTVALPDAHASRVANPDEEWFPEWFLFTFRVPSTDSLLSSPATRKHSCSTH